MKKIIKLIMLLILFCVIGIMVLNFEKLTYGEGVINIQDEIVINFNKYDKINICDNCNLLEVDNGENHFYINLDNGKEILNNMHLKGFSEGYGIVYDDSYNNSYFINESGEIISNSFEDAEAFNNDIALVKLNGKFGVVDKNFNVIIDCIYDLILPFYGSTNIFAVELNNKWGIINKEGEVLIETKYDGILGGSTKLFKCYEDGKIKIKDYKDNTIVTANSSLDIINIVNEDKIIVKNENKVGLIDYDGNLKISFKYDEIEEVKYNKNSLYIAKQNNKYGVIDENENIIINFEYDKIVNADSGIFKVYREDTDMTAIESGWGLIDINSGRILKCKYDEISKIGLDSNIYMAEDVLKGSIIIDIKNENIITEIEDYILIINIDNTDYFEVSNKNGFGIIDINGNEIIECKYDSPFYGNNGKYFKTSGYNKTLAVIYLVIIFICLILSIILIINIFKKTKKVVNSQII